MASAQLAVAPGMLFQKRDYPVLNEYRSMLGGMFVRMYGLSDRDVQKVFPGSTPRDLLVV